MPEEPSLAVLPACFRDVRYVYARHPQAVAAGELSAGANCQLYAYAYLAHHGLYVPPLRSSELWADDDATVTVSVARTAPLDLLLFDGGPRPGRDEGYAAHVAIHLGPDRVLHLCREVGVPAIWAYADFAARPRYARLLGVKRCRPRSGGQPAEQIGPHS
ncbi:cell wall hydrolase [Streptomyces sp. SID3343]|uniref:cell wall hydrolase n=1 Tax=Streptomyces sp. SID3343 TaxID=2690260 RepID=UPI001371C1A6|nr:cell wall hydrolase [Streptomyces sp. SID3343]MYV98860.1 cell wall hydrolase [Streptomyces sp. SID3343]